MSRTYRNISDMQKRYLTWDRECEERFNNLWDRFYSQPSKKLTPTKEEIARAYRDGAVWNSGMGNHYYFNVAHRKARRVEREECQKAYRTEDFEDFDFDDSEAKAKLKGVKWDIW